MVIEKIILVNEVGKIREIINNMEATGCGESFAKYYDACRKEEDNLSTTEKAFFKEIDNNIIDFMLELTVGRMKPEDYKQELCYAYLDGVYGYRNQDYYEICEFFDSLEGSKENLKAIKDFMTECLDEVIRKDALTKEQKAQEDKERKIRNAERDIENYTQRIKEAQETIARLKNS